MAVITRTTGEMTTADVKTGTQAIAEVLKPDDDLVQALPPADPQNPTLAERLFIRFKMPHDDNGSPTGHTYSDWYHVDDSAIAAFLAGDAAALRGILKRGHDQARLDKNI